MLPQGVKEVLTPRLTGYVESPHLQGLGNGNDYNIKICKNYKTSTILPYEVVCALPLKIRHISSLRAFCEANITQFLM